MPVSINPATKVREFGYFNEPVQATNDRHNYTVPIIYGKNARGYSRPIPEGNLRRIVANPEGLAQRMRANKESLRAGVNVPTIHTTRRAMSRQAALNKANKKRAFIEHATYRNTGTNITPLKNYENMEEAGENMENIIRQGVNTYIAAGQENRNHARYAAELNAREAAAIAREANVEAASARGLVRMNASRNLLARPRAKSARKTRKARKDRRHE